MTIDGIDISPKMIQLGKIRLKKYLRSITFLERDIKHLTTPKKKYDACIAVLCVHHLNTQQKRILFKKIFKNLKSDGVFVIGDIIKFDSIKETKRMEKRWKIFLIKNLGKNEGEYWFKNYKEEDIPSSIPKQLQWLKKAGFRKTELIWQHMNYAVICGKK